MNEKQKLLLVTLADLYTEISEEAGNDDNFNQKLAKLEIFAMSIDDAARELYEAAEE